MSVPLTFAPILLVVVVIALLAWFITASNKITAKRLQVEQAFSGVDVWLTNRYNTLTKMVDTLRDYVQYERDTLAQIVGLRDGHFTGGVGDVNGVEAAEGRMRGVEKEIFARLEAYPQLRAGELFLSLQKSIRDCEDNLQAAHRAYNAAATSYNTTIALFPTSIVAGVRGAKPYDLFKAETHKREDVSVRL